MSTFAYWHELAIPIRIEFDDDGPTGVIDAPPEVAKWLEDRIGVAGMLAIHDEAVWRYAQEVAKYNAVSMQPVDDLRDMGLADYGHPGYAESRA